MLVHINALVHLPPAVVLSTLEERLDGVANGSLAMTISSLSVTPARSTVVQFVK